MTILKTVLSRVSSTPLSGILGHWRHLLLLTFRSLSSVVKTSFAFNTAFFTDLIVYRYHEVIAVVVIAV